MPPKKDAKKDAKKADLSPEERMALIEQTLEGEKNNLVRACVRACVKITNDAND